MKKYYDFWLYLLIPLLLSVIFLVLTLIFSEIVLAEINQEGVIGKMSVFESTYPDIVDNEGIGWIIVNIRRNGIPTQIRIKTPLYEQPKSEKLEKIRGVLEE